MSSAGVILEARVQRLFLAQGVFAERSLWPAADIGHRLLATDIDVLVSEYSSGFHLTRRHAECKTGRNVRTLDRVLWLNGVRSMLGADASYLVLEAFDEDASEFAKSLSVDVMTVKQLETWEKALSIPVDQWPNRSNFRSIDPIRNAARDSGKRRGASEKDRVIRRAIQFVEIDSWRVFSYGRLNRLLSLLKEVSDVSEGSTSNESGNLSSRYAASSLLVRLSLHLLAVCLDISRVPVSDLYSYLVERFVYGDQNPDRAGALVRSTVEWMSQALKYRGMSVPPEIDSSRLFRPPGFSEGLIGLTQRLIAAPNEARYLPIAMETEQFAAEENKDSFPHLHTAWHTGRGLAALVKGFAVASLGVDASLLTPLRDDLTTPKTVTEESTEKDTDSTSGQTKLSLESSS